MDLPNVKNKYNTINTVAMVQGAMTFVSAIAIVDAVKEVPLYLAGEKNHLYFRSLVAIIVVVAVVCLLGYLTKEGLVSPVHTNGSQFVNEAQPAHSSGQLSMVGI